MCNSLDKFQTSGESGTREAFSFVDIFPQTTKTRKRLWICSLARKVGKDIQPIQSSHMVPEDDSHFTASVRVAVSPQFYGWVFGLGGGVTILSPTDVAQGMKDQLELVLRNYTVIM